MSGWLGRPVGAEELDLLEAPLLYSHLHESRQPLYDLLEEAVGKGFEPNDLHVKLAQMPFQTVLTTNWDTLIEDAMSPIRPINVIFDDRGVGGWRESSATQVVKVHGTISSPTSIVFGEDDYSALYTGQSLRLQLLKTLFATRSVVMLGFGMRDAHVKALFSHVARLAGDGGNPHYVVVADDGSMELRAEYLRSAGFVVLPVPISPSDQYGLAAFLDSLHAATYVFASSREERTRMLIRETKRLRDYLGPDRTIRLRATMGPLAVPDYRGNVSLQAELFGSTEVFEAEWELRELCMELVERKGVKIRMIGSPTDEQWVTGKGYDAPRYRDRLRAFLEGMKRLGDGFEFAPSVRASDSNTWIVSRLALLTSAKGDSTDQRLYNRAELEVDARRVHRTAAWFDEEFGTLVTRAGGVALARSEILKEGQAALGVL